MTHRARSLLFPLAGLLLFSIGCDKHADDSHEQAEHHGHSADHEDDSDSAKASHSHGADDHKADDGHGHGHDKDHAGHPAPAGDGTLRPIMLTLGEDIDAINGALWREDLPAVAKAAMAIADHPHVGPAEVKRIQGVLGADFAGFVSHDKVVHGGAKRLAEAAAAGDYATTLKELATVQSGCVACHADFRTRLKK